ncbi:MAG: sulfatase-like hydrolase/transferase, partial [Verrucomicrobiota bacterium]
VNAVCAPSRATLLTGRHFLRTGVSHVHGGKDYLHKNERTLGDVFRSAGWKTGMWGKWHLGRGNGYDPWQRGFDEAFAAELYTHENCLGQLNANPISTHHWADTVIVDHAIEFLHKDPGTPKLVYLPTMTPHTPLEAPQSWIHFHRERGLTEGLATLFAMVSFLDEQIGRLIEFLEKRNLLEDTLLIFTSDNGPAINRGILSDEERYLRKSHSPRRGWKGDLWENGVRAPLFLHWPKHLEKGVVQTPLDQVDLFPTILDWCNITHPSTYPELDGKSRREVFEAPSKVLPQQQPIFNYVHPGWITARRPYTPKGIPKEYNPLSEEAKLELKAKEQCISVREGRYKLLLNPLPPEENKTPERILIDLYDDPGETTNLSENHPEISQQMETLLADWFQEIKEAPHSFSSPEFKLVTDKTTQIAASRPNRTEGNLQNTVSYLAGWSQVNDLASYRILAENDTVYAISLSWIDPPPKGFKFELSYSGESIFCESTGDHEFNIGSLVVRETVSIMQLELRSINSEIDPTAAQEFKLKWIEFTPVSERS